MCAALLLQFKMLTGEVIKHARGVCVSQVLGTDMKKHFDILSRFQVMLTNLVLTHGCVNIGLASDNKEHFDVLSRFQVMLTIIVQTSACASLVPSSDNKEHFEVLSKSQVMLTITVQTRACSSLVLSSDNQEHLTLRPSTIQDCQTDSYPCQSSVENRHEAHRQPDLSTYKALLYRMLPSVCA